jgi:hypothetical protein
MRIESGEHYTYYRAFDLVLAVGLSVALEKVFKDAGMRSMLQMWVA